MTAKTDAASLVGRVFNEMYRIVRPIGTGGMGAVYEAAHTRLSNKRYAIKMLHASIAQDAEVFQRFRREAEIATELGHPHIVEVHDFNITPDGAPYMVMEFLEGEDLAARLQKRGPMTLEVMNRLVAEMCSALDAAHGAGIVHRDLKPQNIFLCKRLGRDDFVKIVDFGISKVKDSSSVVTRDHSLMGTPFYMSPEQADGLVQQIDNRTDIFALGAILWEMLTGRMAFEAPTISGAMYKVVHVDPTEVHLIRPDVPPMVSLVLRRAMAKEKEARYRSVVELSHEFANASRGVPPQIMPPPLRGQTMGASGQQQVVVARPQTPLPAGQASGSGQDAFAPTGYVTPAPGQFPGPGGSGPFPGQPGFAPTTPPPGAGMSGGFPGAQQSPFPPSVPPTAFPQQPGGSGGFPPQPGQFTPQPGQYTPQPGQYTPQPGQFVQPGMPGAGTPSTLSGSTGQQFAGAPGAPQAKKGKGAIIGAVAGLVVVGVVAAVVIPKLGDKQGGGAGVVDAGGPVVVNVAPDARVEVAMPPDAAVEVVAVMPDAAPVKPAVQEVTIKFEISYDKAPAKQPAVDIRLDGKKLDGTETTLKKGSGKLRAEVRVPGYDKAKVDVVPDGDKTVQVKLKKTVVDDNPIPPQCRGCWPMCTGACAKYNNVKR